MRLLPRTLPNKGSVGGGLWLPLLPHVPRGSGARTTGGHRLPSPTVLQCGIGMGGPAIDDRPRLSGGIRQEKDRLRERPTGLLRRQDLCWKLRSHRPGAPLRRRRDCYLPCVRDKCLHRMQAGLSSWPRVCRRRCRGASSRGCQGGRMADMPVVRWWVRARRGMFAYEVSLCYPDHIYASWEADC